MTSILVYLDNRDDYKNNLVSIGAEYYKSSVAKIVDQEMFTANRMDVKDFVVGFGHQNSLMKLLFYFEARGEEGFLEYLGTLKSKTALLKDLLVEVGGYENFVEFGNFVLCDKAGWNGENSKYHTAVHQKYDPMDPELVSLHWFGGKEKLCFVASSPHESFSEEFIRATLQKLEI